MKHLKAFEYFGYKENQEKEEEEFLMDDTFDGEEENRFEFDEEEEEEMGMPTSFEEEEEMDYMPPTEEEGRRIQPFANYAKESSTCPSCNCQECECGGGKMAYEAKKADKMTKKEKELASKYPPKDKITRGDIITAAKENADKKGGKKEDKKSEKNPKGKLSKAQEKLPTALKKAIASGVRD